MSGCLHLAKALGQLSIYNRRMLARSNKLKDVNLTKKLVFINENVEDKSEMTEGLITEYGRLRPCSTQYSPFNSHFLLIHAILDAANHSIWSIKSA